MFQGCSLPPPPPPSMMMIPGAPPGVWWEMGGFSTFPGQLG